MLKKCQDQLLELEQSYLESLSSYEAKYGSYSGQSFSSIAGSKDGSGPPIAMFIQSFYRKFSERCSRACTGDLHCKNECYARGARNIVDSIIRNLGRCSGTQNPKKCEKALNRELRKWRGRVATLESRAQQKETKKILKLRKERMKRKNGR